MTKDNHIVLYCNVSNMNKCTVSDENISEQKYFTLKRFVKIWLYYSNINIIVQGTSLQRKREATSLRQKTFNRRM